MLHIHEEFLSEADSTENSDNNVNGLQDKILPIFNWITINAYMFITHRCLGFLHIYVILLFAMLLTKFSEQL